MIILDTNVVSAAMEIVPAAAVQNWFSHQVPDDLYLSVISVAELRLGVELLKEGRRRDDLHNRVELVIASLGPIFVPFDEAAARACAVLLARHPGADLFDLQIAAIAIVHGAAVATRNTKHFSDFGVELVDPWSA